VADYLASQRDVYRYIHDQTLRLANQGATPREIAEELALPASLAPRFANRDYYGTVRHNAKAVYQAYFGWYDGNPANLDPLPPVEEAKRYVEAMGGPDAVLARGRAALDAGDYRWAATLLDHLVFAEPDDEEARGLLAAVYDQLGYQAESGPWRDVYLTAAFELRHGVQGGGIDPAAALGLLRALPLERFFDAMATRLNGPRADGEDVAINLVFTDAGETFALRVRNGVLHHRRGEPDPGAAATLRLTRDFLLRLSVGEAGLRETLLSDELEVEGSRVALVSFFSLLDRPGEPFPIVTP
jgi:alkyl sulfatase BDS1-like metallo-beta-lactamase superfamily hydrolase